MEQLPRLRARLTSLRELRDLVRALRTLAASHLQEAAAALEAMRSYAEAVEDAIAEAAALLAERPVGRLPDVPLRRDVLAVVFSEQGFVGAYNERLLDLIVSGRRADQDLVLIGRRGAILMEERGLSADAVFPMATHVGGVLGVARRVADRMAGAANVDVLFVPYRRGGASDPTCRTILPLDPALVTGSKRRHPPLHQLSPDVLLERLAGEYVFAETTRAIFESLASENGARLRVMEHADQSIGDKLDSLRHQENSLRQEAVTSELLDLVTGAEAVLAEPDR